MLITGCTKKIKTDTCDVFTRNSLGVYSVIARLEPVGEAKSTAELYLSGKGR